ncbi:hypothetical protein WJX73_006971 [Symbiochloris irregularis]|uniref:Uncharacterized protein n=1 Tax=Symbiochloris irregularis TaxID=706552 RepID=A0AAW1NN47_9CHLO
MGGLPVSTHLPRASDLIIPLWLGRGGPASSPSRRTPAPALICNLPESLIPTLGGCPAYPIRQPPAATLPRSPLRRAYKRGPCRHKAYPPIVSHVPAPVPVRRGVLG